MPGDVYRHPRPLPVGEVIEVKLTTPRKPGMGDNRYNFTHANGDDQDDGREEARPAEAERRNGATSSQLA